MVWGTYILHIWVPGGLETRVVVKAEKYPSPRKSKYCIGLNCQHHSEVYLSFLTLQQYWGMWDHNVGSYSRGPYGINNDEHSGLLHHA